MNQEKLINGKVLVIEYHDDGEDMKISHSICADKFKQFLNENINDDIDVLFEDKMENLEFIWNL